MELCGGIHVARHRRHRRSSSADRAEGSVASGRASGASRPLTGGCGPAQLFRTTKTQPMLSEAAAAAEDNRPSEALASPCRRAYRASGASWSARLPRPSGGNWRSAAAPMAPPHRRVGTVGG